MQHLHVAAAAEPALPRACGLSVSNDAACSFLVQPLHCCCAWYQVSRRCGPCRCVLCVCARAGHTSDVDVVRWHPNCHYIATGSSDRTGAQAAFLNSQRGCAVVHSGAVPLACSGHDLSRYLFRYLFGCRMAGQWHPSNTFFPTSRLCCAVRLWDVRSGSCCRLFVGHKDKVGRQAGASCLCSFFPVPARHPGMPPPPPPLTRPHIMLGVYCPFLWLCRSVLWRSPQMGPPWLQPMQAVQSLCGTWLLPSAWPAPRSTGGLCGALRTAKGRERCWHPAAQTTPFAYGMPSREQGRRRRQATRSAGLVLPQLRRLLLLLRGQRRKVAVLVEVAASRMRSCARGEPS